MGRILSDVYLDLERDGYIRASADLANRRWAAYCNYFASAGQHRRAPMPTADSPRSMDVFPAYFEGH